MDEYDFLREYNRLTAISADDWIEADDKAWMSLQAEAVHMLAALLENGSVNP
jgi:hypothetical protein